MEPNRIADRSVLPSPEMLDAALRAFWRGSAGEIDRLAGGSKRDMARLGEMLLLLWRMVSREKRKK
jgi:hypothetical protein